MKALLRPLAKRPTTSSLGETLRWTTCGSMYDLETIYGMLAWSIFPKVSIAGSSNMASGFLLQTCTRAVLSRLFSILSRYWISNHHAKTKGKGMCENYVCKQPEDMRAAYICNNVVSGWERTKQGPLVHGPPLWTGSMDPLHGPGPWTPIFLFIFFSVSFLVFCFLLFVFFIIFILLKKI